MSATPARDPTQVITPPTSLYRRLQQRLGRDFGEAWVFFAPTIILMGGLIAYPFIRAVYVSFTNTISQEIGPFVGLTNYINLWKDSFFRNSVSVTARYTFSAVFLKACVGTLAAILLNRLSGKWSILTGLVLLPWIMPEVVRSITWRGLLDPLYGGLNRGLVSIGLLDKPASFLTGVNTALPTLIMINLWEGIPFFTINLLAGLKAIDQELYEAAAIDGASKWRQFLHITLPGLRYVLIVVTLLSTIWTFNGFTLIFLLTGGGPMNATKVYSILSYQIAITGMRYGVGIAVALTMAPLLGVFIVILGRYMMQGRRLYAETSSEPSWFSSHLIPVLTWPFRFVGRALLALFWLVNNAVEWVFETAGKRLQAWRERRARARGESHWRRRPRSGSTLAAVALVLLLIFELMPFYWVIVTAFKSELQITMFKSLLWPKPWTLAQFRNLLGPARNFMVWLRNTMTISVISPLISTAVASLGAYALARLRWRGANTFSYAILVAYLMPGIMMLIPIYQLFSKLGVTNNIMGLIISYPTFGLPFATWLMMGYYSTIPEELEAAALIDGCNRFQAFFRVVLPLIKPALLATMLYGVTQAWSEFLFAYVMIHSESRMTIPVGLAQMIIGDVLPWGELSAAALIMAIPVLAIYTIGQRFMVAGLTAGAIKGGG
ncbi:MAG: ABC transporter permease subunit [Chloroflexi bacterium]|nr:ABC transporter permease subunit [Chloroflexota bacterium]